MKNTIKKWLALLIQAGLIFYPVLHVWSKKEDKDYINKARDGNLESIFAIVALLVLFLIFTSFRNTFLHMMFIILFLGVLTIHIAGLLNTIGTFDEE